MSAAFTCFACDKHTEHRPDDGHVPKGWRIKNIDQTPYMLCSACGNPGMFAGGIAPILIDAFAKKGVTIREDSNVNP